MTTDTQMNTITTLYLNQAADSRVREARAEAEGAVKEREQALKRAAKADLERESVEVGFGGFVWVCGVVGVGGCCWWESVEVGFVGLWCLWCCVVLCGHDLSVIIPLENTQHKRNQTLKTRKTRGCCSPCTTRRRRASRRPCTRWGLILWFGLV